jgi:CAAX prenyl protease-like protein
MSETKSVSPGDGPPEPHPYLDPPNAPLPKEGLLRRHHWLTVLLPFLVYMLANMFVPSAPDPKVQAEIDRLTKQIETGNEAARTLAQEKLEKIRAEESHKIPYRAYPYVYSGMIGLTLLTMLFVIPGYRAFGGGVHGIAFVVGIVGGVLWIALCKLHLEQRVLEPIGLGAILDMGRRPGFNPLAQIEDKTWAYIFLSIRFFGLVVVVPIIEEFFLRGFLMRYVMHVDWPYIPFGKVDRLALICGTAVPMLMHPAELVAAAVWFSLVTWLMLRTRSIWDCVIAHAVTNLLIGLWVVWSGDWWLM